MSTIGRFHCIRNVNKLRPEVIYKYISETEASTVNKTDIVDSIDELVKTG